MQKWRLSIGLFMENKFCRIFCSSFRLDTMKYIVEHADQIPNFMEKDDDLDIIITQSKYLDSMPNMVLVTGNNKEYYEKLKGEIQTYGCSTFDLVITVHQPLVNLKSDMMVCINYIKEEYLGNYGVIFNVTENTYNGRSAIAPSIPIPEIVSKLVEKLGKDK